MDVDLKDRKIAITGVGDGIGRSLALAFASAGARVAGCARSKNRLDDVAREIEGDCHLFHPADLTRPDELNGFYEKTIEVFGGLDVLINNVGAILKLENFFSLTDQDWQDSFDVNLMPAVRLSRLFIPQLKQSPAPRIINISSVAAIRPGDVYPQYSAMKAGLSNLTVSLAQTLAPDKITVNTVSPGPVWTRSWEDEAKIVAEKTGEPLSKVANEIRSSTDQNVPLKRMGVPEDVTGIVLFLASDSAQWITASNFTVDGGVTRAP